MKNRVKELRKNQERAQKELNSIHNHRLKKINSHKKTKSSSSKTARLYGKLCPLKDLL